MRRKGVSRHTQGSTPWVAVLLAGQQGSADILDKGLRHNLCIAKKGATLRGCRSWWAVELFYNLHKGDMHMRDTSSRVGASG